jgi:RNA polymerase sigma-70 factor (ECF subfamily)
MLVEWVRRTHMAGLDNRLQDHAVAEEDPQASVFFCQPQRIDGELESLPDSELIELLKNGFRQALAVLFIRYRRLVFSISLRTLRDRAEAEDVVQDVFLEICKKAKLFDPTKGSVKMWILQYAYRRSLDRRRYLVLRQVNGHHSNGNGNGNHQVLEHAHSPLGLDGLTLEERGSTVRKALETLSSKQKEVIELAYFQGLLMNEIADQTGETLGNVRNHYYRGLKKLWQALSGLSKVNRK